MTDTKEQLIRLGATNPELRKHIRPILARLKQAGRYEVGVEVEYPDVQNLRRYIEDNEEWLYRPGYSGSIVDRRPGDRDPGVHALKAYLRKIIEQETRGSSHEARNTFEVWVDVNATDDDAAAYAAEKMVDKALDEVGRLTDPFLARQMKIVAVSLG